MKEFKVEPFGKSVGFRLTDRNICKAIISDLQKYNVKLFNENKHKQIDATGLSKLILSNYMMSYKINSQIRYLYLTTRNGHSYCYYIWDMYNIYAVISRFCKSLLTHDTLLVGRIVDGNIFLVEDILVSNGKKVNMKLSDRLKLINDILDNGHYPDPVIDAYSIILKDYVGYNYVRSFMTEYLTTLKYNRQICGLNISSDTFDTVFINIEFDGSILKNENVNNKSKLNIPKRDIACFKVYKTVKPDVYELFLTGKNGLEYCGTASVPDKATSQLLKDLMISCNGCTMICKYDNRDHIMSWRPTIASSRENPDTIGLIYEY